MLNQKSKTFKPRERSNHNLNATRTKMENRQINKVKHLKSNKNDNLRDQKRKPRNHKQTILQLTIKKHKFTNLAQRRPVSEYKENFRKRWSADR